MKKIANLVSVTVALTIVAGCGRSHAPAPPTEVVVSPAATLPSEPADAAWQSAPEYVAKLIPQDMVEPRQLKATTPEVRVRAIAAGGEIVFRLEWADVTKNDLAVNSSFVDACAVQLPAKTEPNVPAPQMGEPGRTVEITYWNAGWQAIVNGRGDSIKDIFPNAQIDYYPFQATSLAKDPAAQSAMAARYAPARALGNNMAGPRTSPVQDLIAEGPGTIAPAKATTSKGSGQRTASGWAVVIARRLPDGLNAQSRTQVAFAVWQGEEQEVGARKMRTGWIPLAISGK